LLREKKVLDKNNIPYQQYVDSGYFRILEQKYTVPNGEMKINIKTMVFEKGIDFIRKRLRIHKKIEARPQIGISFYLSNLILSYFIFSDFSFSQLSTTFCSKSTSIW